MFDLHTHHDRCGHASGGLRDYIEAAIAGGLHTIGLSDHSPFFADAADHPLPGVAMARSEFAGYLAEARRLGQEYAGRIKVLVGVEADFDPHTAERAGAPGRADGLDYVIGSVHVLDGVDLFRRDRWVGVDRAALRSARERYCDLVAMSARSGLFDVLGHVDVIKAVCPEIAGIATPAVDRMLRAIADADVVMEINTSGRTKACGGWYPSVDILEQAAHYGIKVTYGSDAHEPARVGEEHTEVRDQLRALGFRDWYVFEGRRRIGLPL